MAKLIPLEEAAEMLGVTPEKLTEMRSKNEVFGYRDGANWKFKQSEIERVANTLGLNVEDVSGASGVDLPIPPIGSGDSSVVNIDADLDAIVPVDDGKEDTDGPDSVLVSEKELGESDPGASSTIIGRSQLPDSDADLKVSDKADDAELILDDASDISLDGGSELKLDSDSELKLGGDDSELTLDGGSELKLDDGSELVLDGGSELKLDDGSELTLGEGSSELSLPAGSSVKLSESSSGIDLEISDSGSELNLSGGSSLKLTSDDSKVQVTASSDDDMVLELESDDSIDLDDSAELSLDASDVNLGGSGIDLGDGSELDLDITGSGTDLRMSGIDSDVTLDASGSGINLSSPSDSGISLEDTPDEISMGSDIDALELGEADDDVIDLGDEAVELEGATIMADDDFLLEPVEGADSLDEDSGSQVIALDTDEISEDEATLLTDGFEVEEEVGLSTDLGPSVAEVAPLGAAAGAGGVMAAAEAPYTIWNVIGLGICALILALGGMMITDLVRNMWSWNSTFSLNSSLMDAVIGMFGG